MKLERQLRGCRVWEYTYNTTRQNMTLSAALRTQYLQERHEIHTELERYLHGCRVWEYTYDATRPNTWDFLPPYTLSIYKSDTKSLQSSNGSCAGVGCENIHTTPHGKIWHFLPPYTHSIYKSDTKSLHSSNGSCTGVGCENIHTTLHGRMYESFCCPTHTVSTRATRIPYRARTVVAPV